MTNHIDAIEIRLRDDEYEIGVTSYEPYVPAVLGGLPENCYPAEGGVGEYEILQGGTRAVAEDGASYLDECLTDEEDDYIQEKIFEHFEGR
jgi:hypothetical protein